MREFEADDLVAAGKVLRSGVADRLWPGAVAACGVGGEQQQQWVLGRSLDWAGGRRDVAADTVFDLASLTKVLATLPAVLVLVQRGCLGLDDPVAAYVPGVDARVRVRHLLTHTSGLPAHREFAARVTSSHELAAAAAAEALERDPDRAVAYSDLGFVLLGAMVQRVCGMPLDRFANREVFAPVGSSATFRPPAQWLPRIAATEVVDGRATHGTVHDENAAAAGGVAGHAGLFGSLADVCACLAMWLPDGPVLTNAMRAEALRDHTAGTGGHRGLGWTCRGDGHDILSPGWGPLAVSHTGFTGTSVAFDPATQRWAVLLTNAVHYGRNRPGVLPARRAFHAALVGDPAPS